LMNKTLLYTKSVRNDAGSGVVLPTRSAPVD
jgi:hypothetical protein